ncbi:MAG: cyclic nucleotide-binding domain-containing protein [Proteobacteria bacterium]|nr:cyclic nucleotide-binding domain-containing protein [Desulfobacteraceae bacterium]MBU1163608.1 cyclic nucleotide-binding domain-containing protein [Pseudomonadota bacterium]MBU3981037.1 cyclic nucleotide-binding domain-containing protein [Pseudomonadota bacterium]MBU4013459.1 cyclic nucleotide-binding domain-containing protein [Pseudomonadota bacterium]MBU4066685.1 cyclic nucleotide-binding domain-containing protein [Pseudomonadota bacterium]
MSSNEMLSILRETRVFQGLSEEHLNLISSCGNLVTFVKGETIIREGQQGHPLFVVVKGQVEVVLPRQVTGQSIDRGTRIKISDVRPGYCIGEFSLIDKKPASASVIASEPCELIEISRPDWEKIINSSDELAKNIYKNMLLIVIKRARQKIKELDICFY